MKIIEDKLVDLTFEEFCQGGKRISEHTLEPWIIRETATHVTVVGADNEIIFHDDKRIQRVMGDALLIAAAPKMLAALKRQQANIRRWLETGEPATTEESKSISDEIDAAIYAAEGK